MLTFLRKIRSSSINAGATRKYILYALGEIFLVVIGILIALQINNWNEDKKYAENEAYLLVEVLDNLQEDAQQISLIIERRREAKTAIDNLLLALRDPEPGKKLDAKDIASCLTFERYYPLYNAFEMMKSTGLKLTNKTLRSAISRYYDFEQRKVTQSIMDIEEVFKRIMQSENDIRSNIARGKTGSNMKAEIMLKDEKSKTFKDALLSELIPFQDNNQATLIKVMEFQRLNVMLMDQVNSELKESRYSSYRNDEI